MPRIRPNPSGGAAESYPCPCCGYRTLPAEPPGTHALCPVCYWHDASRDQPSKNYFGLWKARANFEVFRASDSDFFHLVRDPTPTESRPPDWEPSDLVPVMAAERDETLKRISAAFDGISRGQGISLHEANAMDSYEPREVCQMARLLDTDERWEEVPEADLARFPWALSYLDELGFRYYLPAYMSWDLWHFRQIGWSTKSDLPQKIESPDGAYSYKLTYEQCHAVFRYLRFLADWSDRPSRPAEVLTRGWYRFASSPDTA